MTKQQRVMWTGLPNGIVQGANGAQLRISVLVTPRLYDSSPPPSGFDSLADFPDFQQWATTVAGIQFGVAFNGGAPVAATVDPASPAPDEDLWGALFSATTPVIPYSFTDHYGHFIQSFPARNIESFIKTAYGKFTALDPAKGGLVPPSPRAVLTTLNPVSLDFGAEGGVGAFDFAEEDLGQYLADIKATAENSRLPTFAVRPSPLDPPAHLPADPLEIRNRFLQTRLFYDRPIPMTPITDPPSPPIRPAPQTEPDFHNAVSALGAYPQLMRRLGLVVDLLVPLAGVPSAAGSTLQIVPTWAAPAVPGSPIRPLTYYSLTATVFSATTQAGGADNGLFDITNTLVFGPSQIDVDGAALKMMQYVNTAGRNAALSADAATKTLALPAIRSGGIQVVHHGRAADLATQFQAASLKNTNLENGTDPTFHAEELHRGFRVDIFDVAANTWRSLMSRDGTYRLPNAPAAKQTITLTDEGYTSTAAAQNSPTVDNSPKPDLYVHEKLFRWIGWSLAAPVPGKAISDNSTVVAPNNTPGQNINMRVDFKATPRSMPRLRFGHKYRVRLRTVDLAGNSLPVTSTLDTFAVPPANAPLVYRRFEPVVSPTVVPHDDLNNPVNPGEAVARLVVRSDVGMTTAAYVTQLTKAGYPGFHADSQRHIAPPKTSEEMAERHGMLDTGPAGVMDTTAYTRLVNLDGALTVDGANTVSAYPVNQLILPYLAEVLARGAAFTGLPGSTAAAVFPGGPAVDHVPFTGKWPVIKPFRVQMKGLLDSQAQLPPAFDPKANVLTVYIKQGDAVDVQLSSYFTAADLALMGMWQWTLDYFAATGATPPKSLTDAALAGLLWWLTPFQKLRLVHPVQRPLIQPKFATLVAAKYSLGQTYAEILNTGPKDAKGRPTYPPIPVSGKSTGKLDLLADWTEPIDDGVDPNGFHLASGHAHVLEAPVAATDTGIIFSGNGHKHQFPDTKYRRVNYSLVATSRFREYFPYTDAEIASGKAPITVASPVVTVDVPNSAPPDAPKVLYVVPAFKWDPVQQGGTQASSTRHGGYMRVYMDRPWFSSGDGELLGVVTAWDSSQSAALEDKLKSTVNRAASKLGLVTSLASIDPSIQPYVTQWGRDPIRQSAALAAAPTFRAFPLADPASGGLTATRQFLLEAGRFPVAISGHAAHFDTVRQLWYSDIQMTWGDSYYPFVRLSLVRFQPISTTSANVSRVIQADFVQLAPDRVATIKWNVDPTEPRKVTVTLAGTTHTDPATGNPGNEVVLTLEQQQPGVQGDLGWVPVPNGLYSLQPRTTRGSSIVTWSTDILLPRPQGSQNYRLVMREYEAFIGPDADGAPPVRRLVYANSVDL